MPGQRSRQQEQRSYVIGRPTDAEFYAPLAKPLRSLWLDVQPSGSDEVEVRYQGTRVARWPVITREDQLPAEGGRPTVLRQGDEPLHVRMALTAARLGQDPGCKMGLRQHRFEAMRQRNLPGQPAPFGEILKKSPDFVQTRLIFARRMMLLQRNPERPPRHGKPYPGQGYAVETRRHARAVLHAFYEYHREEHGRPLLNPFPGARAAA